MTRHERYSERGRTTEMRVNLLLHLEQVSETSAVWWGEAPEIPGFSVTAVSLSEVLARAAWALTDILAEQGQDLEELTATLVTDEPESENAAAIAQPLEGGSGSTDASARVARVTRPPRLVAA